MRASVDRPSSFRRLRRSSRSAGHRRQSRAGDRGGVSTRRDALRAAARPPPPAAKRAWRIGEGLKRWSARWASRARGRLGRCLRRARPRGGGRLLKSSRASARAALRGWWRRVRPAVSPRRGAPIASQGMRRVRGVRFAMAMRAGWPAGIRGSAPCPRAARRVDDARTRNPRWVLEASPHPPVRRRARARSRVSWRTTRWTARRRKTERLPRQRATIAATSRRPPGIKTRSARWTRPSRC